jgi:acyl-CoA thioesterase-2
MAFDLDDLVRCLSLTEVEPGVVDGANLDIGYYRVFGGQILAQIIAAASAASPDKSVKSLSVLFPREGDTAKPMRYRVDKLQDGRTFGTTEVVATQDGKVISAAMVSMHIDEPGGLHRSDARPDAGDAEAAPILDVPMIPWDVRVVDGVDLGDRSAGPPDLQLWMRTPPLDAARSVHQALLAHATDLTLIGTALRPFDGVSQADSTQSLHTAVTSHALWFHQPVRVDDWLLVNQHSPVVAHGRAFGRGDVFSSDGEVVASFAQEAMVRTIEPSA